MIPYVSISKNDWSLHRKGPADQARHNEKVKEAIKGNLADIISEEAIITSDGKKAVKVPVRSLDLPHFRFDPRKKDHVGQGNGNSKEGDVIGRRGEERGSGQGKKAGDQPGIDYYEAEITIDELAALLFEDFGLPNLQQKKSEAIESETVRFNEVRRSGPMSNLDKRRTIMENLKRRARENEPTFGDLKNEDLRFKTWQREVRRESNAVVIAMRDVSGSMGEFEKYVTRTFYFWMVRFLRTKYNNVEIVFITHHTQAKEVDEENFFSLGESGGTKVSSAYELALDIIKERYNPERWNIYPFHFSDGENWGDADNRLCVELVERLMAQSNLFGYGEVQAINYGPSPLWNAYSTISDKRFMGAVIRQKGDVYPALQRFFARKEGSKLP